MMKLNISDPNPPVMVFVFPKKEDKAKDPYLLLRPASRTVLKQIRKETHTRRFKNVRGQIHEYWDVDEKKYDLKLWEYCLPGWGNITDEHGNLIEYSPEKAVFLLNKIPYFQSVVSDKLEDVKILIEKQSREKEKN